MEKKFLSTAEVAKILGVSRIAVFKKIKAGEIKASKIGRGFAISVDDLPVILGEVLSANKRQGIEQAVKKAVKDYGETFKLLGKE